MNAVSNDGNASAADKWNTNHIVVTEGRPSVTEVAAINSNINATVFPNPVVNTLNIQTENAGDYSVRVYDLNGRTISTENFSGTQATLSTSNWMAGLYQVVVAQNGANKVIAVMKQ